MSDYHSPGETELPDVEETPEPRTPPLDTPDDQGADDVPGRPEKPDDTNVELPGDEHDDEGEEGERDQNRRDHGRGTLNDDQPGREDRSTEYGGDDQL